VKTKGAKTTSSSDEADGREGSGLSSSFASHIVGGIGSSCEVLGSFNYQSRWSAPLADRAYCDCILGYFDHCFTVQSTLLPFHSTSSRSKRLQKSSKSTPTRYIISREIRMLKTTIHPFCSSHKYRMHARLKSPNINPYPPCSRPYSRIFPLSHPSAHALRTRNRVRLQ
jgi:hypothetical protein